MDVQVLKDKKVIELLTAVGDAVRLKIIFLLGYGGRLNAGEITDQFDLSRPAISHHLKVLKTAGLIESEKLGQEVYYWLESEQILSRLRQLLNAIEECCPPEKGGCCPPKG